MIICWIHPFNRCFKSIILFYASSWGNDAIIFIIMCYSLCDIPYCHNMKTCALCVEHQALENQKGTSPVCYTSYWVCKKQQSTHLQAAGAQITALRSEIGFTEAPVRPALATVLKGAGSICATSWVDLSLLASILFRERLWRREHSAAPHFSVCFCITWFASVKLLSVRLQTCCLATMAVVKSNLFIKSVCQRLSGGSTNQRKCEYKRRLYTYRTSHVGQSLHRPLWTSQVVSTAKQQVSNSFLWYEVSFQGARTAKY